jgi:hypothetical protein
MIPAWLHDLSLLSLSLGVMCAIVIAADEIAHPQSMWIMNLVWPVTALFGSVIWLSAYFRFGRARHAASKPFAVKVGEAASHCGAGCTLGDILAEGLVLAFPGIAIWLGWKTLFADRIFAVWLLDFACAYLLGIAFQFFTIVPMRKLSIARGLWAAIKADTLSLVAWQAGMYAAMGFAHFYVFGAILKTPLTAKMTEFWFAMQLAMLAGFVTAFPVNWMLIRSGIKPAM